MYRPKSTNIVLKPSQEEIETAIQSGNSVFLGEQLKSAQEKLSSALIVMEMFANDKGDIRSTKHAPDVVMAMKEVSLAAIELAKTFATKSSK